jgi:hypothetical protein
MRTAERTSIRDAVARGPVRVSRALAMRTLELGEGSAWRLRPPVSPEWPKDVWAYAIGPEDSTADEVLEVVGERYLGDWDPARVRWTVERLRNPGRDKDMARNRKTNKSGSCKPGQIKVKRSGYTTRRGTRVPSTEFCIEDQGRPGRTSRGAKSGPYSKKKGYKQWIHEDGSLGDGFLTHASFEDQKKAMRHALAEEKKQHPGDYEGAYRAALGKVMVLNRSGKLRRKYGAEIDRVRDWFVKEYGAKSKHWPKRARNGGSSVARLKNGLLEIPEHLHW